MTLKVIQGLVGLNARQLVQQSSSAKDPREIATNGVARTATSQHAAVHDAGVAQAKTAGRGPSPGERIAGFEKARQVAKEIADRIRGEDSIDAHANIDSAGASRAARVSHVL